MPSRCVAPVEGWPVSTIAALRQLAADEGKRTALALCFAGPAEPAPGDDEGWMGQEQFICGSSNMHGQRVGDACKPMHAHNGDAQNDQHCMAVVKNAVVVRDENLLLLQKPFAASFLMACAYDASANRTVPGGPEEILKRRIERIVDVAVWMKCKSLVLAAFGCGNGGNELAVVAGLFQEALQQSKRGSPFGRVVFAILPSGDDDDRNPLAVFTAAFSAPGV
jgi:uncharacterized protein (TIGR02452 family)